MSAGAGSLAGAGLELCAGAGVGVAFLGSLTALYCKLWLPGGALGPLNRLGKVEGLQGINCQFFVILLLV